jgi:hypothetical protein
MQGIGNLLMTPNNDTKLLSDFIKAETNKNLAVSTQ